MKTLRKYLDKIKPDFEPGGRFQSFRSVFDGFETFLFTPRTTSTSGVHIHDCIDSKRTMIIVLLSLLPCFFFGVYNTGYQHWLAAGETVFPFWKLMGYGFASILPSVVVSYGVGLGIEFVVAQWRKEEIQEGFLVSGLLIPMICPIETPVWMIAVATAFSVIFAKEVFGGTGFNIFNPALVTRAFLFFAYPAQMSGDMVFVPTDKVMGLGCDVADGFTGATPLAQVAMNVGEQLNIVNVAGDNITLWDMFIGLIPGSFAETSTACILLGGLILLFTGVANWRVMLSVFVGGAVMAVIANAFQNPTYPASLMSPVEQLMLGGFAFAAVFMATDPVTGARTNAGKYIYGFLIGVMAILIRTYNMGYPEGAMLAILLMNAFAPLIDYCVVQVHVRKRQNRIKYVK